jgi:lipid-binding SYLF domain-containing protein
MRSILSLALAVSPALLFAAKDSSDSFKRIEASTTVFNEIMSAPDKGIPQEILEKAECIGIVPGLKRAGFILGAKYGKGVLVCRAGSSWSAPSTIRVEGGSIGLQIGAGETDLVFVVMNKSGRDKLMESKFTVGGDASAMAGPVGRSAEAQTDAQMHAEILSYSRARGIFAGISLEGATLRPDNEDNREIYGKEVSNREILTGTVSAPAQAQPLYATLNRYTSAHGSADREKR